MLAAWPGVSVPPLCENAGSLTSRAKHSTGCLGDLVSAWMQQGRGATCVTALTAVHAPHVAPRFTTA